MGVGNEGFGLPRVRPIPSCHYCHRSWKCKGEDQVKHIQLSLHHNLLIKHVEEHVPFYNQFTLEFIMDLLA